MKAIVLHPENSQLEWKSIPDPVCSADEILLRVHCTAVNRADLLQREGKYDPPSGSSPILGLEAAGIVEEVGSNVKSIKPGTKVFCLLSGGAYAELVTVPAGQVMTMPPHFTFEEAAAVPEAFFTAYLNLVIEGGLSKGENLLVHAAASGVGAAAIQLGLQYGANVYATAGSDQKCKFAKSLGAEDCINYRTTDFAEQFGALKMDLILDLVGQAHLASNFKVLKHRGRLTLLSLISGAKSELNLLPLLKKNLMIKGSTLRDRSPSEKAELTQLFIRDVLPLLERRVLKPTIFTALPIQEVEKAHKIMLDNLNLGKIVLTVS